MIENNLVKNDYDNPNPNYKSLSGESLGFVLKLRDEFKYLKGRWP